MLLFMGFNVTQRHGSRHRQIVCGLGRCDRAPLSVSRHRQPGWVQENRSDYFVFQYIDFCFCFVSMYNILRTRPGCRPACPQQTPATLNAGRSGY